MANPYVNKVVFGGETVVDLTGDTATAADVAQGKTFHLANGAQATGTLVGVSAMTDAEVVAAADAGWTNTFTFWISTAECTAEDDMTWNQWLQSAYNTIGAVASSDTVLSGRQKIALNNVDVKPSDVIVATTYELISDGGGGNN